MLICVFFAQTNFYKLDCSGYRPCA